MILKYKKVNIKNINDFYAQSLYDKLHRKDYEKHYIFKNMNIDLPTLKRIIQFSNEDDSFEIIDNKYTISSSQEREYGTKTSAFDLTHFVNAVRYYQKVCCNLENYMKVRSKCVDLVNNYTNIILHIKNTKENQNICNEILEDFMPILTTNPSAFDVKLILFPIKERMYYLYKEHITEFDFTNFDGKRQLRIFSMHSNGYSENQTLFNLN